MSAIESLIEQTPSLCAPDNYSVRERNWRAPSIEEGEEIIFEEPGRVLHRGGHKPGNGQGICCRSHYFRVTKHHRFYRLRVRHGGGEESCSLKYDSRLIDGLARMESDDRFWLLWTIMDVKHDAATKAHEDCESKWRTAAAQKRIKTRKVRDGVKVWIEPVS